MHRVATSIPVFLSVALMACGGGGSSGNSSAVPPPAPPPPPASVTIDTQAAFQGLSFNLPVAMLQAPDDSSRWFIVEQSGVVRVFANEETATSSAEFVDISGVVDCCGEKGLLGMAFHPGFASNGQVFLSYTRTGPTSYVSRFTSQDGGQTLDPGSEEPLLVIPQDFQNHNGGNIAFGPDGFLYIGLGDGGSGNDPNNRAQDTTNLLGAMLRIDVDAGGPYGIPADNPFAGNPICPQGFGGIDCPEIWAHGLRNPWRWSFDAATGDLWLGDVGQNDWEEVDIIVRGGNYGWRLREGARCNPNLNEPGCNDANLIDPVAEYNHSVGRSITGGYVYRGNSIDGLAGSFVYADFGAGRVFRTIPLNAGFDSEELLNTSFNISSFGQALDGELYLLDYGSGTIHRMIDAG